MDLLTCVLQIEPFFSHSSIYRVWSVLYHQKLEALMCLSCTTLLRHHCLLLNTHTHTHTQLKAGACRNCYAPMHAYASETRQVRRYAIIGLPSCIFERACFSEMIGVCIEVIEDTMALMNTPVVAGVPIPLNAYSYGCRRAYTPVVASVTLPLWLQACLYL